MTKIKPLFGTVMVSLLLLTSGCLPLANANVESQSAQAQNVQPVEQTPLEAAAPVNEENVNPVEVSQEAQNQPADTLADEANTGQTLPAGGAAGAGRIAQGEPVLVQGWLGSVESLPDGAQFDDQLVLVNEEENTLGINGTDETIQQEINNLKDQEEPGKYAHFWGELVCDVMDVNGCQLQVSRIRVGAVESEPETIDNWEGTISLGTFNGATTFVFTLNGRFSMQYGIPPTGEATQAILETAVAENAIVRVSGTLITGIPDVNGSRIIPDVIEIVGYSTKVVSGQGTGETNDGLITYTNEPYGYQISYPNYATLTEFSAQTFPPAELPQDMDVNQYMEQLINQYGNNLCVRIESGLGYISISGSVNTNQKYVNCGRENLPTDYTKVAETLSIGGQEYTAKGYQFSGADDTLTNHGETYELILSDGTIIEYGSVTREGAAFNDYQMKGYQSIREILQSFIHLD